MLNREDLLKLIPESIRNNYGVFEEEIAYNFSKEFNYEYTEKEEDSKNVSRLKTTLSTNFRLFNIKKNSSIIPCIEIKMPDKIVYLLPYKSDGFIITDNVNEIKILESSFLIEDFFNIIVNQIKTQEEVEINNKTENYSDIMDLIKIITASITICLNNVNINTNYNIASSRVIEKFVKTLLISGAYNNYDFKYNVINEKEFFESIKLKSKQTENTLEIPYMFDDDGIEYPVLKTIRINKGYLTNFRGYFYQLSASEEGVYSIGRSTQLISLSSIKDITLNYYKKRYNNSLTNINEFNYTVLNQISILMILVIECLSNCNIKTSELTHGDILNIYQFILMDLKN